MHLSFPAQPKSVVFADGTAGAAAVATTLHVARRCCRAAVRACQQVQVRVLACRLVLNIIVFNLTATPLIFNSEYSKTHQVLALVDSRGAPCRGPPD